MQKIVNQPRQGATLFLITRRAFAKKKEVAPWKETKILIAGCQGQIGVPLTRALCKELGASNVIAADVMD
jgi:hypothetical protein